MPFFGLASPCLSRQIFPPATAGYISKDLSECLLGNCRLFWRLFLPRVSRFSPRDFRLDILILVYYTNFFTYLFAAAAAAAAGRKEEDSDGWA